MNISSHFQGVPDTEHGVGAITGALTSFPTEHVFQAQGSPGKMVDPKMDVLVLKINHLGETLVP